MKVRVDPWADDFMARLREFNRKRALVGSPPVSQEHVMELAVTKKQVYTYDDEHDPVRPTKFGLASEEL